MKLRNSEPGTLLPGVLTGMLALVLAAGSIVFAKPQERSGEVVATQATGRVVFCVTHDSIVVAAVPGPGEAGSHAPAIVPIRADFIGVLLGAMDWTAPGSGAKPMRLDAELTTIAGNAIRHPQKPTPDQPSDIEDIGVALLETLRPFVTQIHKKLDFKPDEPLMELVLADYVPNYGAEIWTLQYRVRQQNLGNGFWSTTILRPAYYQLYPPEKGQPRTFVEVAYPPIGSGQDLASLLAQHDPVLERIRASSPDVTKAIDLISGGNSVKAATRPVTDFVRAALANTPGADTKMTMAVVDSERGFQWILAPDERLPAPQTKPVDPDAPSLRNPRAP